MSTRSIVARKTGDGTFSGVFVHWDGHPESVGKSLYDGYNGYFEHDLKRMERYLLDDHPAGWECLAKRDFSLEARYVSDANRTVKWPESVDGEMEEESDRKVMAYLTSDDERRPMCRCHGDADCSAETFTQKNRNLFWAEYLYILDTSPDGDVLMVCNQHKWVKTRTPLQKFGPWGIYYIVPLDGPEPNWDLVKRLVNDPGAENAE